MLLNLLTNYRNVTRFDFADSSRRRCFVAARIALTIMRHVSSPSITVLPSEIWVTSVPTNYLMRCLVRTPKTIVFGPSCLALTNSSDTPR